MQIAEGIYCPLLKKDCITLKCAWFTQVRGTNPQTGKEVDEFQCAVKWLPMLMIEVAKETRQGAAATESFRNEVVKRATDNARLSQTGGRPPRLSESRPALRPNDQYELFRDPRSADS